MNNKKLILGLAVASVLAFILYSIVLKVSRTGEFAVEVRAIPSDSEIYLNDKKINQGTYYLGEGSHVFLAKKQFFDDDEVTVEIPKNTSPVVLVPGISTGEARQYFEGNEEEAKEREKFFAEELTKRDEEIESSFPIINSLPYSDRLGPFRFEYGLEGASQDSPGRLFLELTGSTPEGRIKALVWIRQQGYDPTDLDIRYLDFKNPLVEGDGS